MEINKETSDRLSAFIRRVENLNEQKKEISDNINEVMSEAVSNGFDKKAMNAVLKLRKMTESDRIEHESILETYKIALNI